MYNCLINNPQRKKNLYNLIQIQKGEVNTHEENLREDNITDVIDQYESMFSHLGFGVIVSVRPATGLPTLKIFDDSGEKKTEIFIVEDDY